MAEEIKTAITEIGQKTRRSFVKTAAQVAVTAPAVGLLLSASTKPASAQITPYQATSLHILDDFTYGNNHEDIDACKSPNNPSEDDTFGGPNCPTTTTD